MVSFIEKSDWPRTNTPIYIGDPSVVTGNTISTYGIPVVDPGQPISTYTMPQGIDPLHVWRTQPSVRKVVDFIGRNVASVPWHAYVRLDDTDRKRVKTSPAEIALQNPARFQTGYHMWRNVVIDSCLYDAWCVVLLNGTLQRIPPRMLMLKTDVFGVIEQVLVTTEGVGGNPQATVDITDLPMAIGTGWSGSFGGGVSPMLTLASILREQLHAIEWRDALWQNGPKTNGYLKRPIEAPGWQQQSKERFIQSWRSFRDSKAGGTPILEDGMDYVTLDIVKPSDAQDIQGRQLTDAEVSSAFHIAPELVGARQGTFSNVAAFRQMLFGPALGPRLDELQQAVNAEIVPALDATPDLYVELDREKAMNGSFMEQAQFMSTAIGGPWMTRNEGRAKLNLPDIDGGDDLITPLNVTAGGQASPQDSGTQNQTGEGDPNSETAVPKSSSTAIFKAAGLDRSSPKVKRLQDEIAALYKRQTADLKAGVQIDAAEFHKTWDPIAAEAIHEHLFASASASAQKALESLNAPSDVWSADVMHPYVSKMSETIGAKINTSAVNHINAPWPPDPNALLDDTSKPSKKGLLDVLETVAVGWAVSALVNASGFGAQDGAGAAGANSKTWVVDSDNPRPSHAAMDGETVGFDETFSNGCMWPGDGSADVAETANCTCGVVFTVGN